MSARSDLSTDFDLWDIVCCSRCQLPFLSKTGPTIPFWLTECGHILCNNHLSPDQSCFQCGAREIQLMPLQKEMESPMADWFRSIPLTLDSVIYSVKFQQEMMALQIIALRSRCGQQRAVIERLRAENSELKKINQDLRNGNSETRFHVGDELQQPSDIVNPNGKRPWDDPPQLNERTSRTSKPFRSSYAANTADLDKFTLASHQPLGTNLAASKETLSQVQHSMYDSVGGSAIKPAQALGHYACDVPSTLQYRPAPLSRAQAAPLAYQQRSQPGNSLGLPSANNHHQGLGRPPSRFKPAMIPQNTVNQGAEFANSSKFQKAADREVNRMRSMGPPPTPQHLRYRREQASQLPNHTGDHNHATISPINTNRFLPTSNGHTSNLPPPNSRRFLPPPTPINGKTHPTR